MIRSISLFLLIALPGLAGKAVITSGNRVENGSLPNTGSSQPWRLECMVLDWGTAPLGYLFQAGYLGAGLNFADFGSGNYGLRFFPQNLSGVTRDAVQYTFNTLPTKVAYVRTMYTGLAASTDMPALSVSGEVWDKDGNRQVSPYYFVTGTGWLNNYTGVYIGNVTGGISTGFCRVHTTLVPLNSRPPTTFDNANRLDEWKFDDNLTNSVAGRGYDLTPDTGTVSYTSTIPYQGVVSKVQTVGHPIWSDQVSMRAGFPNQIDGSNSYSQSDTNNTVIYKWDQISGPSTSVWSSRTTAQPTLSNLIFGPYTFRLSITDGISSAFTDLATGAVAMDNNGVVIHANPNADKIFGPMIAFGKNPWGYADDAHQRGMKARSAVYTNTYGATPKWKVSQTVAGNPLVASTVAYNAAGVASSYLATTTADMTTTSMTIPVSTLVGFDRTYPTVLTMYALYSEQISVCGDNGTNLFYVCYDGRSYDVTNPRPGAWPTGTTVYQRIMTGTGTAFQSLFCPAGAGLDGDLYTSAGTVAVTAGSATITGTGTNWIPSTASGGYWLYTIRIQGTHSGIPFVFFAQIGPGNTATSINAYRGIDAYNAEIPRPWPADADTASGLSYSIIADNRKTIVPQWTRPDGSLGYAQYYVTSCLSDTRLAFNGGYELFTGQQSGKTWAYLERVWMGGNGVGTANFYQETLANYSLYFRSGQQSALDAARYIADNWLDYPDFNQGLIIPQGRNRSMVGQFAREALDTNGTTRLSQWGNGNGTTGLRAYATYGVSVATGPCIDRDGDQRNMTYALADLALAAQFDPDTTSTASPTGGSWNAYWNSQLAVSQAHDTACQQADNSFSTPGYASGAVAVSAINGNPTLTGTGFLTSGLCGTRTGSGTATVVTGSDQMTIVTGTMTTGAKVVVVGTLAGVQWGGNFEYFGSGTTGAVITLSGQWPGVSGTVPWASESDGNTGAIFEVSPELLNSTSPQHVVSCTITDDTHIALTAGYPGPTATAYMSLRGNFAGYGWQPLFAGIKAFQLGYSTAASTGATKTAYAAVLAGVSDWVKTKGYDPATKGVVYARGYGACEPVLVSTDTTHFSQRNFNCNSSITPDGLAAARVGLSEPLNAFRQIYEADPTTTNRTTGDNAYAALWGQSYCLAAVCGDGVLNYYSTDPNLALGKWYGFQFGVGMSHQWPAVRLGGAAAADNRTINVWVDPAAVSGASSVKVTLTYPSGKVVSNTCNTAGVCVVVGDGRAGDHLLTREYWSGAGATGRKLAASSEPQDVRLR